MTKHRALQATIGGTVCIALAYASAFFPGAERWGAWLMIVGLATLVIALMVLGAVRRGAGLGRLGIPLLFTFVVMVGGFGAALVLPANEGPASHLVLGLPLRAAIVLYGVGLLPLFLLPLVYAWTFEEMTLTDAHLAQVRELRREHLARLAAAEAEDA